MQPKNLLDVSKILTDYAKGLNSPFLCAFYSKGDFQLISNLADGAEMKRYLSKINESIPDKRKIH